MSCKLEFVEYSLSDLPERVEKKQQEMVLKEGEEFQVDIGEFPITFVGRDTFVLAIHSETMGRFSQAFVEVDNGKPVARRGIVYNSESIGRRISTKVRLRPGANNVKLSLVGNGTDDMEEFEVKVVAPGRLYISGVVQFLLQENSRDIDDRALDNIAVLAKAMNRYLKRREMQVFIKDKELPPGMVIGKGAIELSRFNFLRPDRDPDAIAWHEFSHVYYERLAGDDRYYLKHHRWKPYGEVFEALFKQVLEISLVEGAGKDSVSWSDMKPNSVMELFNSAAYCEGQNLSEGHPQNHEGELFAYGSEILLFHSDGFRHRLSKLEHMQERELALRVAGQIASAYILRGKLPDRLKQLRQWILNEKDSFSVV